MSVVIGHDLANKTIRLDLPRLIETRALIQANSGGGKSWAIRRLLEQSHGKVQQIVIDPEGEFRTLRERFDYILAGRDGGDCQAEPKTAKLLAERLLELNISAVVDIYELHSYERQSFVKAFLSALINAPKRLWHPALIVVDEAHMFCPQTGSAEAAGAVIDLMTRGRKRGFCGVLATQRISKLHKDAAAEANNKLIGRTGLDIDMKRAADELGFTSREDQHRLRHLEAGHFFAFGPALSMTVTEIMTGPVQTTHPKPGQRAMPVPAPREAVRAALAQLEGLAQAAEAEASEIDTLRKTVADLRRQARAPVVDQGAIEQAERKARVAGKIEGYGEGVQAMIEPLAALRETLAKVLPQVDGALSAAAKWKTRGPSIAGAPAQRQAALAPAPRQNVPRIAPTANGTVSDITPARQKILNALAWLEALGIEAADKSQVALLIKVSPTSGGYFNNLGALRSAGLIDYPTPGALALTEVGRGIARAPSSPPTTAELHAQIERLLPAAKWKIVAELIDAYPKAMHKDDLANQIGVSPTSGGYFNNLGSLRTLGLIDYPQPGHVVAKSLLFLQPT